jgi:hypothetical protein
MGCVKVIGSELAEMIAGAGAEIRRRTVDVS